MRLREASKEDGETGKNYQVCFVIGESWLEEREKVFKVTLRPAMTYGTKTCNIKKMENKKIRCCRDVQVLAKKLEYFGKLL